MKPTKNEKKQLKESIEKNNLTTRRDFLRVAGVFFAGAAGVSAVSCDSTVATDDNCMGYILVDPAKCQGCLSCMIACSLVNEGSVNLSLSRIQVQRDTFGTYPNNIQVTQCRQCTDPKCVDACTNGALTIDRENGNIRVINRNYCNGCGRCVQACPYIPSRPMVASDPLFDDTLRSRKCDLCLNAPYHWDSAGGGVDGQPACVAVCPLNAIKFTTKVPEQEGDDGYNVNMRGILWGDLGLGYDVYMDYGDNDA